MCNRLFGFGWESILNRSMERVRNIIYKNKEINDAFESFNPKELVVGIRRPFDDGNKILSSKRLSKATIHNFFEHFRHPETYPLTPEISKNIETPKQRTFVLFDKGGRSDLFNEFKNLAGEFRLAFQFVHADLREEAARQLAEFAQVDEKDLPSLRIFDTVGGVRRVFEVKTKSYEEIIEEMGRYEKGEFPNLLKEVTSEL